MKIFKIVLSWAVMIAAVLGIAYASKMYNVSFALPRMPPLLVIAFALSFAFMWVDVLRWGVTRPFNCIKCMTGWSALLIAFLFHAGFWYFYLPLGLFVGAVFEGIKMRYL